MKFLATLHLAAIASTLFMIQMVLQLHSSRSITESYRRLKRKTNLTGTCLVGISSCKTLTSLMLRLDWKRWLVFGMIWGRRVLGLKDSAMSCTSNSVTTATFNTSSCLLSMLPWTRTRSEWMKSRCRCYWITGTDNLVISTKRNRLSRHSKMFSKELMTYSNNQRNVICPCPEYTCTHMALS